MTGEVWGTGTPSILVAVCSTHVTSCRNQEVDTTPYAPSHPFFSLLGLPKGSTTSLLTTTFWGPGVETLMCEEHLTFKS